MAPVPLRATSQVYSPAAPVAPECSLLPLVKYLSLATSTFILRCSRTHYRLLWAALTVMDRVPVKDGRPCLFRVVRVSGTMRKAEEEAIRQARALILAARAEASSATCHLDGLGSGLPQEDQLMLDMTDLTDDDGDQDEG